MQSEVKMQEAFDTKKYSNAYNDKLKHYLTIQKVHVKTEITLKCYFFKF